MAVFVRSPVRLGSFLAGDIYGACFPLPSVEPLCILLDSTERTPSGDDQSLTARSPGSQFVGKFTLSQPLVSKILHNIVCYISEVE